MIQLSRYAEHPMLPGLKAKNEQAFQRWCARDIPQDLVVTPNTLRSKVDYSAYNDLNDGVEIEFEDLHEVDELEALDKLLRLCDRGDWKARVTANLEDIFMCGTSIPGSCQHEYTRCVQSRVDWLYAIRENGGYMEGR